MSLLEEILFLAGMAICGLIPFVLLTWLMQKGKNGLALTILSVLGAGFTVMIYATNHDFGIDQVRAIGIALIFFLPALLGGGLGALLGWLVRLRRERWRWLIRFL